MNKIQEYISLADIKLMKLVFKASEKIAFLTGASCFKQGKFLLQIAPIMLLIGYGVGYTQNNDALLFGFGVLISALWVWMTHRQIKTMEKIKRLAEDGRLSLNAFAYMLTGSSSLRLFILIIGPLGTIAGGLSDIFWLIAHLELALGLYLLWHWEPPKDTLKKRVKDKLAKLSFTPAPLPSPS